MWKSARKLWPLVYPYRMGLLVAFLAGLAIAVFSTILPFMVQLLIQALEKKDILGLNPELEKILLHVFSQETLRSFFENHFLVVKTVALGLPVYYLIFGFFRYYNTYKFQYIAEMVTNEMRFRLMDKFLTLNSKFYMHNTHGSGGLLSRTLNDTMMIQGGMGYYTDLFREPIIAIVLTIYMFVLNWQISLFCVLFLPFFSYLIRKLTKTLRRLSTDSQETLELVTKNLKEGLDGMRVIQSFNLEDHMRAKFRNSINDYNRIRRKVIKRMQLASPVNEVLASLLTAGIVVWIGHMIFGGQADVGEFIAFIVAAGFLDKPVKRIQQAMVMLHPTSVSLDRIFEIIDSEQLVSEISNPRPFPKDWKTIEFRNVSFSYGTEIALKNVNLKINRGEIVALVGESGSGKSTMMNLLERFFDPDQGGIYVDNIPLKDFSLKDLRANIALVTQDVFLFNEDLEENIRAGNHVKDVSKVHEAIDKANARKFIDRLPQNIKSLAGERGSNFSGGEKQRISIARAIFKDAPILILDEATSALDSASEVEVQKGIQSLMQGRTAFVIAHRLSTIASADRIVVMSKGEIMEEGTHKELLGKDGSLYSYFHKLQLR
ncbi:MAG: ATP-binding cassette domain-containing protein [Bdellovibrionales bacterium]|nr:ATP-binding cassette domain-containing protein [Bdellovibrionales bacterium]